MGRKASGHLSRLWVRCFRIQLSHLKILLVHLETEHFLLVSQQGRRDSEDCYQNVFTCLEEIQLG